MTMISILWSAATDGALDPFITNFEYLAAPWTDCEANGESAVQGLIENWMGESEWDELFGSDATVATVLIEIHSPPSIAGRYIVDLERVVRARARKEGLS